MRIFQALIVILGAVILFLIPLTSAMYDFQTDLRTDVFYVATGAGETSDNVTLVKSVYDDDATTISVISSLDTDVPVVASYNSTAHSALISGLTAATNRNLSVSYDVDALPGAGAIVTLSNRIAWIFLLMAIAFPAAAIAAIFTGRA